VFPTVKDYHARGWREGAAALLPLSQQSSQDRPPRASVQSVTTHAGDTRLKCDTPLTHRRKFVIAPKIAHQLGQSLLVDAALEFDH